MRRTTHAGPEWRLHPRQLPPVSARARACLHGRPQRRQRLSAHQQEVRRASCTRAASVDIACPRFGPIRAGPRSLHAAWSGVTSTQSSSRVCVRCGAAVPAGRRVYCSARCSNAERKARWRRRGDRPQPLAAGRPLTAGGPVTPADARDDRSPERPPAERSQVVTALAVAAAHQRQVRASAHAGEVSARATAEAARATAHVAELSAQLRSVSADASALARIVQQAVIARRPDAAGEAVRALVARHLPESER